MKNTKFVANVVRSLTVLFFLLGTSFAEAKVKHSGKHLNRSTASVKNHKSKAKVKAHKNSSKKISKKKSRRH